MNLTLDNEIVDSVENSLENEDELEEKKVNSKNNKKKSDKKDACKEIYDRIERIQKKENRSFDPEKDLAILDAFVEDEFKPHRNEYRKRIVHAKLFSVTYIDVGFQTESRRSELVDKILTRWLSFRTKSEYDTNTYSGNDRIGSTYPFLYMICFESYDKKTIIGESNKSENEHIHCFLEFDEGYQWCNFNKFDLHLEEPMGPTRITHIRSYVKPMRNEIQDRPKWWKYIIKTKLSIAHNGVVDPNEDKLLRQYGVYTNMTTGSQFKNVVTTENFSDNQMKTFASDLLEKGHSPDIVVERVAKKYRNYYNQNWKDFELFVSSYGARLNRIKMEKSALKNLEKASMSLQRINPKLKDEIYNVLSFEKDTFLLGDPSILHPMIETYGYDTDQAVVLSDKPKVLENQIKECESNRILAVLALGKDESNEKNVNSFLNFTSTSKKHLCKVITQDPKVYKSELTETLSTRGVNQFTFELEEIIHRKLTMKL